MTSHQAAIWRQKCFEGDDWWTTVGGFAHVVAPAVDDIQTAATVRVSERHFACTVATGVSGLITGSDVTARVSLSRCEVDAFLGFSVSVGVGKTHRFTTCCRAAATQDGAAGSRGSQAGTLQPLCFIDRLRQFRAATCRANTATSRALSD